MYKRRLRSWLLQWQMRSLLPEIFSVLLEITHNLPVRADTLTNVLSRASFFPCSCLQTHFDHFSLFSAALAAHLDAGSQKQIPATALV